MRSLKIEYNIDVVRPIGIGVLQSIPTHDVEYMQVECHNVVVKHEANRPRNCVRDLSELARRWHGSCRGVCPDPV